MVKRKKKKVITFFIIFILIKFKDNNCYNNKKRIEKIK